MRTTVQIVLSVLAVVFTVAVGLLLVSLFHAGCATFKPDRVLWCEPTEMFRALPHSIHGVIDCYSCKGARACATSSNDWCCVDDICSDCTESPVSFGERRPHDGGAR